MDTLRTVPFPKDGLVCLSPVCERIKVFTILVFFFSFLDDWSLERDICKDYKYCAYIIVSGMCQPFCHFGYRDERSEALGGNDLFLQTGHATTACGDAV